VGAAVRAWRGAHGRRGPRPDADRERDRDRDHDRDPDRDPRGGAERPPARHGRRPHELSGGRPSRGDELQREGAGPSSSKRRRACRRGMGRVLATPIGSRELHEAEPPHAALALPGGPGAADHPVVGPNDGAGFLHLLPEGLDALLQRARARELPRPHRQLAPPGDPLRPHQRLLPPPHPELHRGHSLARRLALRRGRGEGGVRGRRARRILHVARLARVGHRLGASAERPEVPPRPREEPIRGGSSVEVRRPPRRHERDERRAPGRAREEPRRPRREADARRDAREGRGEPRSGGEPRAKSRSDHRQRARLHRRSALFAHGGEERRRQRCGRGAASEGGLRGPAPRRLGCRGPHLREPQLAPVPAHAGVVSDLGRGRSYHVVAERHVRGRLQRHRPQGARRPARRAARHVARQHRDRGHASLQQRARVRRPRRPSSRAPRRLTASRKSSSTTAAPRRRRSPTPRPSSPARASTS
jgi:hypothetical protein